MDRVGRQERAVGAHVDRHVHVRPAVLDGVRVEAASAPLVPLDGDVHKDGQRAVHYGALGGRAHTGHAAFGEKVDAHRARRRDVVAKRVAPALEARRAQKVVAQPPLRGAAQHLHHARAEKLHRQRRQRLAPAHGLELALLHLRLGRRCVKRDAKKPTRFCLCCRECYSQGRRWRCVKRDAKTLCVLFAMRLILPKFQEQDD